MFRRLLLDDWMSIFTLVAFVTALSVYLTITYRALRMRRAQIERFASLPFQDESALRRHE
ncbi:MAG TPA: hypothetical protein VGD81_00215 [Opitutaceae bacterium]